MQRHLLVGPGALGIATATAIVSAGDKLDILCRPEKRDAILRHGLRREGLLGQATIPRGQIHVCSSPPELSGGPPTQSSFARKLARRLRRPSNCLCSPVWSTTRRALFSALMAGALLMHLYTYSVPTALTRLCS